MKKCSCYEEFTDGEFDPFGNCQCGMTVVTKSMCCGTKNLDECTCGGDQAKCDFYPEKREAAIIEEAKAKPATIYYAHHQWKYGTTIERYELDFIRRNFPNAVIFNPATDLRFKNCGDESIIMAECISKITNSDIVIFSSMDGMIGIGVYNEVMAAKELGKSAFYMFKNALRSEYEITVRPERNSDRLYADVDCKPLEL